MASELFVDTSGFFALLAPRDNKHDLASQTMRQAEKEKRRLITTDHVLDETTTLLKARGEGHLAESLFDRVFGYTAWRIEWTDEKRFAIARAFFIKHLDQAWSFTDCLSFCVMKQLSLREALTADHHFHQAGFVALLK